MWDHDQGWICCGQSVHSRHRNLGGTISNVVYLLPDLHTAWWMAKPEHEEYRQTGLKPQAQASSCMIKTRKACSCKLDANVETKLQHARILLDCIFVLNPLDSYSFLMQKARQGSSRKWCSAANSLCVMGTVVHHWQGEHQLCLNFV